MGNEQKKLFENITKNTKEAYVEFLNFHSSKNNLNYLAYTIFWSFAFLLCAFLAFGSGARVQGVLCTILLISFISYRIFRPKMIVNREMKSDKLAENSSNKYTFYDKNFEVKNKNGLFSYKYFMLKKIFETNDYYYLYVSQENAFLVSKNTFSLGTPHDFGVFMKSKCHLRFKPCKTKIK